MFTELHCMSCIRRLCLKNCTAFLVSEGHVYRFTPHFLYRMVSYVYRITPYILYRNLRQHYVVCDESVGSAAGDVPSTRLLQTTRSLDQGQCLVKDQGHLSEVLLVMSQPQDSYKQQQQQQQQQLAPLSYCKIL